MSFHRKIILNFNVYYSSQTTLHPHCSFDTKCYFSHMKNYLFGGMKLCSTVCIWRKNLVEKRQFRSCLSQHGMSEGRDSPVSFFTLYTILVHLTYGIPSTTFLPVSFPRTSSIYVMFSTSLTIHTDIPTAGNFENDYLFVLYYSGGAFCFC